ncbi:hypothetical protein [Salipaludibacillus agaradhaerens]|nr:hypothetical protein [Salipaludibacillus agaradhaerens]
MAQHVSENIVENRTASVQSWLYIGILTLIPGLNIVIFLALAVSEEPNKSLQNFGRAALINIAIAALAIIIVSVMLSFSIKRTLTELLPWWVFGWSEGKDMSEDTSKKELVTNTTSIKGWLYIGILSLIPFVNIVAFFLLAFIEKNNASLKNYARAALLQVGIAVVAIIIVSSFHSISLDVIEREILHWISI